MRWKFPNCKSYLHTSCGFTLIELLVVMAIVTILSMIGIVAYSGSQASARDVKRKNDMRQMQLAFQQYYQDYGVYFNSSSAPGGWMTDNYAGTPNWTALYGPNPANYSKTIPHDPQDKTGSSFWNSYVYVYNSANGVNGITNNQFYILGTHLEQAGYAGNQVKWPNGTVQQVPGWYFVTSL